MDYDPPRIFCIQRIGFFHPDVIPVTRLRDLYHCHQKRAELVMNGQGARCDQNENRLRFFPRRPQ
jgi:hypothetical protein